MISVEEHAETEKKLAEALAHNDSLKSQVRSLEAIISNGKAHNDTLALRNDDLANMNRTLETRLAYAKGDNDAKTRLQGEVDALERTIDTVLSYVVTRAVKLAREQAPTRTEDEDDV